MLYDMPPELDAAINGLARTTEASGWTSSYVNTNRGKAQDVHLFRWDGNMSIVDELIVRPAEEGWEIIKQIDWRLRDDG